MTLYATRKLQQLAEAEAIDPRRVYAVEAPVPEVLDVTFDGGTHDLTWDEPVEAKL